MSALRSCRHGHVQVLVVDSPESYNNLAQVSGRTGQCGRSSVVEIEVIAVGSIEDFLASKGSDRFVGNLLLCG